MYYRYVKISDDQIKWKRKINHIVGTVLNSNRKIAERQHRYHLHTDACLFRFLAWTLMKSGSVKLVLLAKMTNLFYVYFRITTTKRKVHKWKAFFLLLKTFKLFGFELTPWRLFQKHAVRTKFDIYVFTSMRWWWYPFCNRPTRFVEY